MEGFTVEVTRRENLGKSAAKGYRREGFIPVEVYQKGAANISGLVQYFQFLHLGERAKISQVFLLKSNDKDIDGRAVLVREIQRNPLSGKPIHIDFLALKDDEEIEVEVALNFVGEAIGVKQDGGIINVVMYNILVSCLPKDIPSEIKVEVSLLRLNDSIHAGEVPLPKGVKLVTSPEEPVVTVSAPKAEIIEAPVEAAAVEGAEAGADAAEAAAASAEKGAATSAKGAEKGAEKEKK